MQLTVCALTSDVRKVGFEPDLPERNCCVKSGECLNCDVHKHAVIIIIHGFIHSYVHTYIHTCISPIGKQVRARAPVNKVKVKCTILQALRLCTGRTAHRASRGIALLFLEHGTRRG